MKWQAVLAAVAVVVALFPVQLVEAVCKLGLELVAAGLNRPVGIACPDDGSQRMFVLEQHTGRIRIVDLATGTLLPESFLTISGLATGNEQGLLGMAFEPNFPQSPFFYINVTVSGGTTEIRRYTLARDNSNQANAASMAVVLSYAQPYSNHNGGWMAFGPDGYLYISTGDGGSGFDPGNRAQSLNTLLGKLLRIDTRGTNGETGLYGILPDNPFVMTPGARPEIWAYGLRNPWRCSFDRATGDLYIADVGQSEREEVNFQPVSSTGGENYGWRVKEGTLCSDNSQFQGNPPCNDPIFVPPIHEYTHAVGISVTGGYVYRGQALGGFQGTYFFADYDSARIWTLRWDGSALSEFTERTAELDPSPRRLNFVSSFGQDADGELYILELTAGEVYRIVTDEDPVNGDLNNDCQVDFADLSILAGNWMAGVR
ncbi:MAG: PQQ-dependent sugar dehydrogenase [Sedimentisphaerales bacterium]|nr:PQQ-dependent sugar dehydrogenase [Sedimentisphaerales bacterium]